MVSAARPHRHPPHHLTPLVPTTSTGISEWTTSRCNSVNRWWGTTRSRRRTSRTATSASGTESSQKGAVVRVPRKERQGCCDAQHDLPMDGRRRRRRRPHRCRIPGEPADRARTGSAGVPPRRAAGAVDLVHHPSPGRSRPVAADSRVGAPHLRALPPLPVPPGQPDRRPVHPGTAAEALPGRSVRSLAVRGEVGRIGSRWGFSCDAVFCRTFKQAYGLPPANGAEGIFLLRHALPSCRGRSPRRVSRRLAGRAVRRCTRPTPGG